MESRLRATVWIDARCEGASTAQSSGESSPSSTPVNRALDWTRGRLEGKRRGVCDARVALIVVSNVVGEVTFSAVSSFVVVLVIAVVVSFSFSSISSPIFLACFSKFDAVFSIVVCSLFWSTKVSYNFFVSACNFMMFVYTWFICYSTAFCY